MLKPPVPAAGSTVRNSKYYSYKGFKVKHVVQVFVLLALCTWLLNQARKSTYADADAEGGGDQTRLINLLDSDHKDKLGGVIKLGRKDIDDPHQQENIADKFVVLDQVGEEVEGDEEVDEENKIEETDQEKLPEEEEQVEDRIDEDDRD